MKTFDIIGPDEAIRPALVEKINNLTKPKGSLGMLESLALQVGLIQQSLTPILQHPQNIIFAADHGIVEEGVSLSPKEITWQQISNFLHGGAGVNFLCRQHGFTLKIVDAGVDYDLPYEKGIINMKVRKGTRNYLHEAAMTETEMELCLERGAEVVRRCREEGSNILSFGEMGIGNTSSSSLWMSCFTGIPLKECVGAGSGLDDAGIRHKYEVLKQSLDNYKGDGSPPLAIRTHRTDRLHNVVVHQLLFRPGCRYRPFPCRSQSRIRPLYGTGCHIYICHQRDRYGRHIRKRNTTEVYGYARLDEPVCGFTGR